jgi:hypothetical protein
MALLSTHLSGATEAGWRNLLLSADPYPQLTGNYTLFYRPKLASDISRSLSRKYLIRNAGKMLLIPALKDAGQVSMHAAAADRGDARRSVRPELMSEKGQVVT